MLKSSKIENENKTVGVMIDIYCHKHHGTHSICDSCNEIKKYSFERLSKCQFGEHKPSCKKCSVHCYKPEKRAQIKEIMRFSGPRMLYLYPIYFLTHFFGRR